VKKHLMHLFRERRRMGTTRARVAWLLLTAWSLSACGGSSTSSAQPQSNGNPECSTRTQLLLVDPIPGSVDVPTSMHTIEIVSNLVIQNPNVAIAAVVVGSNATPSPSLLAGPVAQPTPTPTPVPTPTPFPTPTPSKKKTPPPATPTPQPLPFPTPYYYYIARGFNLHSERNYQIDVAQVGSNCTYSPIAGATFRTAK
jgi:hypothetical protein